MLKHSDIIVLNENILKVCWSATSHVETPLYIGWKLRCIHVFLLTSMIVKLSCLTLLLSTQVAMAFTNRNVVTQALVKRLEHQCSDVGVFIGMVFCWQLHGWPPARLATFTASHLHGWPPARLATCTAGHLHVWPPARWAVNSMPSY